MRVIEFFKLTIENQGFLIKDLNLIAEKNVLINNLKISIKINVY